MNPKTRQRALRCFLGALLQSDLSPREMHEIAEAMKSGELGSHLGEMILDIIQYSEVEPQKEIETPSMEFDVRSSIIKAALDTVVKRRLSKKQVLQLMAIVSPEAASAQMRINSTVRELIARFLKTASYADAMMFLNILEGEPTDAYLKGISNRNRTK